jgi:glycosyltransferase involved in cell wall biosynthesis
MILYLNNTSGTSHTYASAGVIHVSKLKEMGFPIQTVNEAENKILRMFNLFFVFFKYQKQAKLVIISVHSSLAFYYSALAVFLSRLFAKPFILVLHGGNLPARLKRSPKLSHFVFDKSYFNISPSNYLMDRFSTAGYKVKYIPNQIDLSAYPFKQRTELKPNIFWLRSFDHTYNPGMAIDTLAILLKKYPSARLCMAGPVKDVSFEETKIRVNELGLSNSVLFPGLLSKKDWIAVAENYDIFINTTNIDNQPVSVIEIMALGMPIVSTNAGGIPYLLEDEKEALLVNVNDSTAMAEKIDVLLNDPAKANLLAVNARHKAEGFDWEILKKEWAVILKPFV